MGEREYSTEVPELSGELIRSLDVLFSEKCADLSWPDREVWVKAGQRSVVRFLIEQHRRQNTR